MELMQRRTRWSMIMMLLSTTLAMLIPYVHPIWIHRCRQEHLLTTVQNTYVNNDVYVNNDTYVSNDVVVNNVRFFSSPNSPDQKGLTLVIGHICRQLHIREQ